MLRKISQLFVGQTDLLVKAFFVGWFLFVLSLGGIGLYIAYHFIEKFW
jgi:hypothetical protein